MANTKFNAQYQSTAEKGVFNPEKAASYAAAQQQADATYNRLQGMSEQSIVQNAQYAIQDANVAASRAKDVGKDLMALGKLSSTLSKQLFEQQEKVNEREMQEGLAEAYDYGVSPQELEEHRVGVAQLKEGEQVFQGAAQGVFASGGDYSQANRVKSMSGWRQYGYAMGLAKQAGANYGSWMQERMAQFSGLPLAEQAANMANLRNQFFSEMGLTGMNKVLLAEHAFPAMQQADSKIMGGIRKQYAIDNSLDDQGRARSEFEASNDMGAYLTALSTTVDKNGNVLGYRGAWDMAMQGLKDRAKAGLLTEADIRAIEAQEQGDTGKTFGQLHATKFKELRDFISAKNRTDWTNRQNDMKMEREMAEQTFIDGLPDDYSDADLDAAEERLDQIMPGVDSKRLDNLRKNSSVDAKAMKAMEDKLTGLAEAGLLTPQILADYPLKLQRKFRDVAGGMGDARSKNGNFKPQMSAIKLAIENIPEVAGKMEGKYNYTVPLYTAQMEQKFLKLVAEGVAAGNPNAVQDAQAQVISEIQNLSMANGTINKKGEIVSMVAQPSSVASRTAYSKQLQEWDTYLGAMGANAFSSPGAFFDEPQLEAMAQGYGKPDWKIPDSVQYLANKTGLPPMEIINRQRKASGMVELPPPAAIQFAEKEVNPAYQKLLNTYQSPERSIRGLGSSYKYDPSVVPRGYGDAVSEAAAANGVDPSILAGLIETESAWNPTALSSAGARGLGQFMPATAAEFGVDVNDPVSSINGAARYLRYLTDYFKGDVKMAIYAYNGGMGNIERYGGPIPGNRENNEYYGKVMKGAAKYGYGTVAYKDPGTMRPSMRARTLAYTSGNIGPTSTGAHLDVKRVDGSYFDYNDLDEYVEVEDPELGTVPLGAVPQTGDWASHTRRGSHGRDYGLYAGTPIYIKNGAVVVQRGVGYEHGDNTIIRLPDGRQFRFLHGTAAKA